MGVRRFDVCRENNYLRFRRLTTTVLGCLPFIIFGSKIFNFFAPLPSGSQFFPYLFKADLAENVSPILTTIVVTLLLVFLLIIVELFLESKKPFTNIGHYLLGVVYLGVPFALLISISYWHGNYAPLRVMGLLLLTWTNDTMAYVVGSKIGKTPFFARISPIKPGKVLLAV